MASNNFEASGTIAVATFVKVSGSETVAQAGAGDFPIGIAQEWNAAAPVANASAAAASAGDQIKVYGLSDICMLQSSTAGWTAGAQLKPDASGNGVAASSNDTYGAVALDTISGSALGRVQVIIGKK